ncbi:MAG: Sec-independent protein translocase protein TatB [Alphaproteobacteria bacterium]|jgi:sec-independent protein translocase protein TatB|nr:twin-arginine translocase subunit TatB [Rhodospirillaceae bacterium]MDP6020487.1 Sec-independent protein translocase protein TatB [Alphaproteobacteria bacterium]MDP6254231.1 Sec-independent protein translocase protein TatB [Alphaproteobacteria bacterium]MDP7052691.1 Sec-independent protein translocase protein TatB [Alphaproteobacteria bacterium]MDP7229809.1 Sec-independent protein translocase protein TatB [Alphaproteobacteria bacterium]|tara:strand:- start:21708 stop:22187 length:480 start_codon:yes stop_codon:yes gene_type:complete
MLDIGWTEILVIAVVAIVVIGPKDLPRTLRTVGQWIAKARGITRDLQNSVNDMIAESEIDELRKAGESLGEIGSPEMMGPDDFKLDNLTDQSKSDSAENGHTTPPATPLKWPPDDEVDASDEELADLGLDLSGNPLDSEPDTAAVEDTEGDVAIKSTDA